MLWQIISSTWRIEKCNEIECNVGYHRTLAEQFRFIISFFNCLSLSFHSHCTRGRPNISEDNDVLKSRYQSRTFIFHDLARTIMDRANETISEMHWDAIRSRDKKPEFFDYLLGLFALSRLRTSLHKLRIYFLFDNSM